MTCCNAVSPGTQMFGRQFLTSAEHDPTDIESLAPLAIVPVNQWRAAKLRDWAILRHNLTF